MMGGIFLLLGSNLGDRAAHLNESIRRISAYANVIRSSSIYESQAWGNTHQPDFLNQAIEIDSGLSPEALLNHTLETETGMGRDRIQKWGPRTIDIDLLFYQDRIIQTPRLSVPHPEIQHRKFALAPMAELCSDLVHPVLKKTMADLDRECTDPLWVIRR